MITTTLRWLSLALIFGPFSAQAATLANFNFNEGSLSNAASPIFGVTISTLTSDSAFLLFTSSSDWDSAAQISGASNFFTTTGQSGAGNAVTFTITAASGFRFSLDGFSFQARSTATAPGDIGFKIDSNFYDFSESYSNNLTITNISNSSLGLIDLTSATISIQGWNASGTFALQLDDLILTGTVVPEPSSFILCMFGALILLQRRR
ncbi:MAG: hypothetical protein V4727_02595 [Verrucomicrobiota bacterium]